MNKQEILAEISELKEKLNNLEKQYEALTSPNNRWRGDKDDIYYHITAEGVVYRGEELATVIDDSRYTLGNYFKTEEEAEFEIERLKVIAELKKWATPADDFDWDNDFEEKYTILLESDEVKVDYLALYQVSDLYFKTKEQALNAVKAVGEDRIIKYYFRRGENSGVSN